MHKTLFLTIFLVCAPNTGIAGEFDHGRLGIFFGVQFQYGSNSNRKSSYFLNLRYLEDQGYQSITLPLEVIDAEKKSFIDNLCRPRDSEECKKSRTRTFFVGLGIAWVAYEMGMFDFNDD